MLKELRKVLRKDTEKESNLLCEEINIKVNDIYSNDRKKIRKKIFQNLLKMVVHQYSIYFLLIMNLI